ncbi:Uncharacterised protein [Chlamydia abortus]|nr:Uncharacterised protein [Chlamydia abortus]
MIFMYKILSFGRSCKAYLRNYKDSGPNVTLCCENCGHRLHKHGRYYRYVAGKTEYLRIPIYRWLCPKCDTSVNGEQTALMREIASHVYTAPDGQTKRVSLLIHTYLGTVCPSLPVGWMGSIASSTACRQTAIARDRR